jgi:hypothetical protein
MVNDDLVKCPLCGGFTHVRKPELLTALKDPKMRQQIERFVEEFLQAGAGGLTAVAAAKPQTEDFNRNVHNWNPNVPVWRRSPKE